MKWVTFYGQEISITSLSHQHLSNIDWYYRLVLGMHVPEEILYEIGKRFGGIKLPYHPMVSFKYEMDTLFNKGYITNKFDSDIYVDGIWVGKILYN